MNTKLMGSHALIYGKALINNILIYFKIFNVL